MAIERMRRLLVSIKFQSVFNANVLNRKTLSPFFGKAGHKDVKHYSLQDQIILPFTRNSQGDRTSLYRTPEFEGGFAKAIKVYIHPDHHNFESFGTKVNIFVRLVK
jgi:hypothetical protein